MSTARLAWLALAAIVLIAVWRASQAFTPGAEPAEQRSAPMPPSDGAPEELWRPREEPRAPVGPLPAASGASDDFGGASPRCSVPREPLRVLLTTPGGDPFTELASELGLEPHWVFAGGFRAWEAPGFLAHDAPPPADITETGDSRFRASREAFDRRTRSDPRSGALAGTFDMGHWREGSIGLYFHRRFLGWRPAPPSATEARFEISLDDVRAALSSLRLRVVERGRRAAIAGATVVLEETGERRAFDERRLSTDSAGLALFEPLLPGDFQLIVIAPEATEYRARITVEPASHLDLGDVELWKPRPIRVSVRDERGRPIAAKVEVGAYRRGVHVGELLSPRTWPTDEHGVVEIPSPAAPTFLRARIGGRLGPGRTISTWSAAVALEPADSTDAVELVIGAPVVLALRALEPGVPGLQVLLEDALGLVLLREPISGGFDEPLPAGRYRLSLVDRDGTAFGEREIWLAGERVEVVVP